jgi:hypothetical protein
MRVTLDTGYVAESLKRIACHVAGKWHASSAYTEDDARR